MGGSKYSGFYLKRGIPYRYHIKIPKESHCDKEVSVQL